VVPSDTTENQPTPAATDDLDTALLRALGHDPVGLDALQARTGLATPALLAQLMALELQGQVARMAGGLFQRTAQA
jgi:DNA processing protein